MKSFLAFTSLIIIFVLYLFSGKPGLAAVRCETQYGGTQLCVTTGQLQVNKKVCDPAKGSCDPSSAGFSDRLVDNLGINDHKFAPGEEVTFRISVKNIGDATLNKINVIDTPQVNFFELASGSLNFDLTNLKPGETQDRDLRLKVLAANQLPQNNLICVVNAAEANADNQRDRDTAQLCLERKVLGAVKEVPKTGFESWLATIAVSIIGLFSGFKLTKFAKQNYIYGNYSNFTFEERLSKKIGGEK